MAKISKAGFTKEEWRNLQEQRRYNKQQLRLQKIQTNQNREIINDHNIAFVLGNGVSRKEIDPNLLKQHGKIYGCNALYRSFAPDYLVAVDVKMILEINKSNYQKKHEVWTNNNRSFDRMSGFNYFHPSKGWSSGPTALWLASQHRYNKIYILGFDFQGLEAGKMFNNIYADTVNYKKSSDGATFYGNWLRQTKTVIVEHSNITYIRVILQDTYNPPELKSYKNFRTMRMQDFKDTFQIY